MSELAERVENFTFLLLLSFSIFRPKMFSSSATKRLDFCLGLSAKLISVSRADSSSG